MLITLYKVIQSPRFVEEAFEVIHNCMLLSEWRAYRYHIHIDTPTQNVHQQKKFVSSQNGKTPD
jgi:hypothetical protein